MSAAASDQEQTVDVGFAQFPLLHAPNRHCGTRTWTAAYVMAAKLTQEDAVRGRTVLELGSGTGVLGIALALAGAHVVATDAPEIGGGEVWRLLEANVAAARARGADIEARALDWSEEPAAWPALAEPPDLIVGSELLYWGGFSLVDDDPLWDLPRVIAHFAGPDTRVVLAQEVRERPREAEVRRLLESDEYGFEVRDEDAAPWKEAGGMAEEVEARVWTLVRR